MNVWLIQVGEPLPIDSGPPRLWRTGLLAQRLAELGHDVVWWATTFEHWTKQHRFSEDRQVRVNERLLIYLLHSPGYRKNISLGRMIDHALLARHFRRVIEDWPPPDVIHCGFPTIEMSAAAVDYGQAHGVPVVLDTRDLWPDIFVDAVPRLLQPVAKLALGWHFAQARKAFRGATAISGNTPSFVDFGLRYAGRPHGPLDRSFAFAYPTTVPSAEEIAAAERAWEAKGVAMTGTTPVVCYFGTFGAQHGLDFLTCIEAARILHQRGRQVQMVMSGTGPKLAELTAAARDCPNVVLPGWVDYASIWTMMRRSAVGLLPYLPAGFALNLPNKVIEYLSGSLPVLTSLTGGHVEALLREHRCGAFYEGKSPASLADAIETMLDDPEELRRMGTRAQELFAEQFTAERVYDGLVAYLGEVAAAPVSTAREPHAVARSR